MKLIKKIVILLNTHTFLKRSAFIPYGSGMCLKVYYFFIGYIFILFVTFVLCTLKYSFERKFHFCPPSVLSRLSAPTFLCMKRSTVYKNVQFVIKAT